MELTLSSELTSYMAEVNAALSAHTAVTCDADVEATAIVMKEAKDVVKQISAARRSYTDKLDAEKKRILTQEKALVNPIEAHLSRIKSLTDAYLEKRRKIAEAAKAKAAEEAQRSVAQASAMEAFGITAPASAEPSYTLTPTEIQSLEKLSGVSSRTTWSYKVIDLHAVPRQFLTVNDAYVKGFLKAEKTLGKSATDVTIPGIEVFEKTTTVIR